MTRLFLLLNMPLLSLCDDLVLKEARREVEIHYFSSLSAYGYLSALYIFLGPNRLITVYDLQTCHVATFFSDLRIVLVKTKLAITCHNENQIATTTMLGFSESKLRDDR